MPYVAPAWYSFSRDRDPLLENYKGHGLIHATRTLDEYFYHRCRIENMEQKMKDRNCDQVLSKYAHNKDLGATDDRVLVNVGQLWVWIMNKGTLSFAWSAVCCFSYSSIPPNRHFGFLYLF